MKRVLQGLSVGSVALACVLVSGTGAHAASDYGDKYKGCKNYVKVWRDGGKVYAYGTMTCDRKVSILRPEATISSYRNGQFKGISDSGLKGCARAKTCKSKTVSMKAHKGLTYRALNAGTASIGRPGAGDMIWPKKTQAVATYKY